MPHLLDRLDQIHFKLYASVDRGGYHLQDLEALGPTIEELIQAANWARTHDPSEGFLLVLKDLLEKLGYPDASRQL